MDEFTENMLNEMGISSAEFSRMRARPFKPLARYEAELDMLIIQMEGGTYIASQVEAGSHIWLLHHPDDNRVVGVKIEGFSHLAKGSNLEWALRLLL